MMGIDKTRAKMYNDCTCQGRVGFSLNSGSHAKFITEYSCAQRAHNVSIRLTLAGSVVSRYGLSAFKGW